LYAVLADNQEENTVFRKRLNALNDFSFYSYFFLRVSRNVRLWNVEYQRIAISPIRKYLPCGQWLLGPDATSSRSRSRFRYTPTQAVTSRPSGRDRA